MQFVPLIFHHLEKDKICISLLLKSVYKVVSGLLWMKFKILCKVNVLLSFFVVDLTHKVVCEEISSFTVTIFGFEFSDPYIMRLKKIRHLGCLVITSTAYIWSLM